MVLVMFLLGGWLVWQSGRQVDFENLEVDQMRDRIVEERDLAIEKAMQDGDYKCCIHPPCTMCFMEANKWNNFTPGTCACDDLIAQGEEPCPQCKSGLCEKNTEGLCKVDNNVEKKKDGKE